MLTYKSQIQDLFISTKACEDFHTDADQVAQMYRGYAAHYHVIESLKAAIMQVVNKYVAAGLLRHFIYPELSIDGHDTTIYFYTKDNEITILR